MPLQSPFVNLILAQDSSAPPVPGEAASPPAGAIQTPGGPPAGGSGAASSPLNNQFFLILVLMVAGMLVFSMLGTRRDKKKRESMLSAIKKHDRVQTIGGVIGSVVEVKPDTVVLKVDESSNTRITFSRAAIQQVLSIGDDGSSARNAPTAG